MHICFITSEFPKAGFPHGGVGTFIKMLGSELVKNNIKVSVIGINYGKLSNEEDIIDGVHVYRLQANNTKGLSWFFNTKSINKKLKQIHQNQPIHIIETAELGLAFLQKLPNIKYVIRMHGGHHFFAAAENRSLEKWKVYQEIKSFKKADAMIAVSNYVGTRTQELMPKFKFNFKTIYNPIDTDKFFQADHDFNKYTIFFAGSLVEKKGIRQLIQALKIVKKQYPQVQLQIAGKFGKIPGVGTSYQPILENEITQDIKDNIQLLGLVPNNQIPQLINKAHICCYPSHMEAMPIAWLEVLAMGKIFVASNTGPGPEIIEHGVTGFLANPHNPEDIAAKIIQAFNVTNTQTMQNTARENVLSNYNLKYITQQNINFYTKLINEN